MGLYFEEKKKKDQGVVSTILVICAVLALVVWVISKLWTLIKDHGSIFSGFVVGGLAVMIIWSLSKCLFQDSEEDIKFRGATSSGSTLDERGVLSNWLESLDENSLLFQRRKSISMAVGTVVGWTMLKLFGGMFRGATLIALVMCLVTAAGISNWLRSLEEKKKKKKNRNGVMSTVLAFGAAAGLAASAVGLAALAGWGISKSFGSEPEPSKDKDKMMKAPGRGYYMPRKDFEGNPSAYFRNNRANNY